MEKRNGIIYYDECDHCKKEFRSLYPKQLKYIMEEHSRTHKTKEELDTPDDNGVDALIKDNKEREQEPPALTWRERRELKNE
jgi:hypothetical protein